MAKKKSTPQPAGRNLPISWNVADDLVSRYATHLVVQHGENEYILSLFEVRPPLLVGRPEETLEKLNQLDAIQANCVARIIVAADRLPEFAKVLQDAVNKSMRPNNAQE